VSTEVTYYALALGVQDSETGQYVQGFTPSTIDMILVQHEPSFVVLPSGVDSQNTATGYTATQIFEGDRVESSNGLDYVVNTVVEHAFGDKTIYYECELALLFPYTQSDVTYPWPAPPTTGGMALNVGVSTWDACTILSVLNQTSLNTNDCEVCELATVLSMDTNTNDCEVCELATVLSMDTNTNDCEVCTITTVLSTGVV